MSSPVFSYESLVHAVSGAAVSWPVLTVNFSNIAILVYVSLNARYSQCACAGDPPHETPLII